MSARSVVLQFERLRIRKLCGWWVVESVRPNGTTSTIYGAGGMLSWPLAVALAKDVLGSRRRAAEAVADSYGAFARSGKRYGAIWG